MRAQWVCSTVVPVLALAAARAADDRGDVVEAKNGVVVTVSAPASEVGVAVLKHGGTAVDAAVATALALAVTYPAAGNLGGGGFLLYHPADGTKPAFFDFRETAPAAATPDMFVKPDGRTPFRRVGVPGTVRGLALAHARFGKLPWKDLVAPSIELAEKSFVLDAHSATLLNRLLRTSAKDEFAELHRVFTKPDAKPWKAGDRLMQPDLARTLRRISADGTDGFYKGETAELIVAEMKTGRGLITRDDLAAYVAKVREPLRGQYRGFDVVTAPPPSSGGTALIEMLNILEPFDLARDGRWSPRTVHRMTEAMRRAYCDRARFLGDPDFVMVPARLTSKEYARELADGIDPMRATPSESLAKDIPLAGEGENTTHIFVVDKTGAAVSLTYTLESTFGSRVVVRGAGFLLNDEMNDFNWQPGVTDRTGRIGTKPNLIAPGKRMLSSMTPTILAKDGKPVLVTGSPGGRTIINTVLCVVVNVVDFGMDARAAVDEPRHHHQWFPDKLRVEPVLAKSHQDTLDKLRAMGHVVETERGTQGDAHTIQIDTKTGTFRGAADRRLSGKAAGY
jgi:gamma-glutamyltranspeptidase/glutathione hydrolase